MKTELLKCGYFNRRGFGKSQMKNLYTLTKFLARFLDDHFSFKEDPENDLFKIPVLAICIDFAEELYAM